MRLKQHRGMLIKGNHHSIALQRAWNKYGAGAFQFNVLAILEERELASAEQRLLDICFIKEPDLYNIARGAYAPMRGRKHTAEWHERSLKWKRGNRSKTGLPGPRKGQKLSDEELKLRRERNPRRVFSAETRAKMSAARMGRTPWNKGKTYKPLLLSDDTRAKLRAAANKRWQQEKEKCDGRS